MKTLLTITLLLFANIAIPFEANRDVGFMRGFVLHKNYAYKNNQIDLKAAWKIERGNRDIKVAVIDTGIDHTHPFLTSNVVGGYDFLENSPVVYDGHGHGTHIAGIIRTIADVSIYSYRFFSKQASDSVVIDNLAKSIYRAVSDGCHIINISAGGNIFYNKEYYALKYAESRGVLVITAAGNENKDLDMKGEDFFPAEYPLTNIISVANTDEYNYLAPSSNYGVRSIDLGAPGNHILSTGIAGSFGIMTGTSQATAIVTGIAALMLSKNPRLNPIQVRKILMDTTDKFNQLSYRVRSGGRINAFRALSKVQTP